MTSKLDARRRGCKREREREKRERERERERVRERESKRERVRERTPSTEPSNKLNCIKSGKTKGTNISGKNKFFFRSPSSKF